MVTILSPSLFLRSSPGYCRSSTVPLHAGCLLCGAGLLASRASAAFEGLSADVEDTIARLDKKSKSLDKDNSSAANQKMLRTLLEKL